MLDGIIRLYEVSGGGLPNTLTFCNETDGKSGPVRFAGRIYNGFPTESSSGWERSLDGALPRPTITVSNMFSEISSLVRVFGLRNAIVIRKSVFIKNLDNGASPDPTAIIQQQTYYISRISWNSKFAIVNLRSPLDVENFKIPRRTVGSLLT